MKILIVGRGGRCHAIIKKLAEENIHELFAAPGNAGMQKLAKLIDIDELDNKRLLEFALKEKIDLTIVGPDAVLMNGLCDLFRKNNLMIFGPNKESAMIEGSKEFAKIIMQKASVKTARYESFTEYEKAEAYVRKTGVPIVIKNDGLAAGKGVVVAYKLEEALDALRLMLIDNTYNTQKVIIEEFLEGEEFSLMAFVEGENVYPMPPAQDHKRAFDNDLGPNTGGMGAYCPVPFLTKEILDDCLEHILKPVALTLVKEQKPFSGILYAGLILTKEGPKVIEFNARFGDPETEVVLPKLKNKLTDVIFALHKGVDPKLEFDEDYILGAVMASKGYPGNYQKGFEITMPEDLKVFHMGTAIKNNKFYTNGGRVLFVLGKGKTLKDAYLDCYKNILKIKCDNLFFRKDIGKKHMEG